MLERSTAGNLRTFRDMKDIVRLHHPEVVFISETTCDKKRMDCLRMVLNFKNCLAIDSRGLSEGLCFFWYDDMVVDALSYFANHIACNICWCEKKWRFLGIYGCPKSQNKKIIWELLRKLANVDDFPWLIGGGLNECLWEKEKKGGSDGHFQAMGLFREVVRDLHLRDLGFKGDIFTWSNKGRNCPIILKRLDRFLSNSSFIDMFDQSSNNHLIGTLLIIVQYV